VIPPVWEQVPADWLDKTHGFAVGFTGTRQGMRPWQKERTRKLLVELGATSLHIGDCRGADEDAYEIGRELGLWMVGHPPTASGMRAYLAYDEERTPLPFLSRNHMIVRQTAFLIAAPLGREVLRSGTWATVRYARQRQSKMEILKDQAA
jgi:hypothetical protein